MGEEIKGEKPGRGKLDDRTDNRGWNQRDWGILNNRKNRIDHQPGST